MKNSINHYRHRLFGTNRGLPILIVIGAVIILLQLRSLL